MILEEDSSWPFHSQPRVGIKPHFAIRGAAVSRGGEIGPLRVTIGGPNVAQPGGSRRRKGSEPAE